MPNNLATFTTCAEAPAAISHKNIGGYTGWLVNTFLSFTGVGRIAFLGIFLALLVTLILSNPVVALVTYTALMVSLLGMKDWYYNLRLMCVWGDGKSCLVGTIIEPPHTSFDGDATLNILPAPYTDMECFAIMTRHLDENKSLLQTNTYFDDLPFHNGTAIDYLDSNFKPDIFNTAFTVPEMIAHKESIAKYLHKLRSADPMDSDQDSTIYNNILIGFADRLLDDDNLTADGGRKNFYNKYFRKDNTVLDETSVKWEYIPQDYDLSINWQAPDSSYSPIKTENKYELNDRLYGLNPMFNFHLSEEGATGSKLLPYVHCEIDGDALARLLDIIMVALTAFIAAFLLLSFLGPAIAGFLALLVLMLFLIIGNFINNITGGGEAGEPDIDYEDPDDSGDGMQAGGDMVAMYGNWIMDTEHGQYFEIHPVRAYYIMGRNSRTGDLELSDSSEERAKKGLDKVTNDMITEELAEEICKMMHEYDQQQPADVIDRKASDALSYGLNTRYSGGRFAL